MKKIKVIELFGGIGAPRKALENLGYDVDSDYVEIDPNAVKSYNAIYGENFKTTDVSKYKYEGKEKVKMLVGGFPCQDISNAGLQKGFSKDSNTRSSLAWQMIRIIEETLPENIVSENVTGLLSKRFEIDFRLMIGKLESLGYDVQYEVLVATDFGVPQKRKRVFIVANRTGKKFKFSDLPGQKSINEVYMDHVQNVISNDGYNFKYGCMSKVLTKGNIKKINKINKNAIKQNEPTPLRSIDEFITFQNVNYSKLTVKQATEKGYIDMETPGVANLSFPKSDSRRGRVIEQGSVAPTILTGKELYTVELSNNMKKYITSTDQTGKFQVGKTMKINPNPVPTITTREGNTRIASSTYISENFEENQNICGIDLTKYKVRKITPNEAWRLMGFEDEDFNKAKNVGVSNAQLYKQAGNSIVVQVLEAIFEALL